MSSPTWRRWRRAGWVGVAIVAAAAVMALWSLAEQHDKAAPGAAAGTTASAPAASASTRTGACGVPAGDQRVPTSGPLTARIDVGHGVSVPSIDGVGPARVGGVSHCFAHSPTGALLAAANFLAWNEPAGNAALKQLLYPNADAERIIAAAADKQAQPATQIVGFQISRVDADQYQVTLAFQLDGVTAAWPMAVRWSAPRDDWGVVAPPTNTSPVTHVNDLSAAGFISWQP
ncbi:hypothetical protein [Acidipropionibacterium timonense]|uniref:hypothetical protein n=1 Tax=Acidipropionibacterium timonense TaxID=2161818 RepID=UPI00102F442C|nr:hypothetical protein [Acidipropionibacterium timonense]